jgi:hypothetical protein
MDVSFLYPMMHVKRYPVPIIVEKETCQMHSSLTSYSKKHDIVYSSAPLEPSARSQEAAFEQPGPTTAKQQPRSKSRDSMADLNPSPSNVVNVNLLLAGTVGLVRVAVVAILVELETDTLVALVAVGVCLVDLCVFRELAVGF